MRRGRLRSPPFFSLSFLPFIWDVLAAFWATTLLAYFNFASSHFLLSLFHCCFSPTLIYMEHEPYRFLNGFSSLACPSSLKQWKQASVWVSFPPWLTDTVGCSLSVLKQAHSTERDPGQILCWYKHHLSLDTCRVPSVCRKRHYLASAQAVWLGKEVTFRQDPLFKPTTEAASSKAGCQFKAVIQSSVLLTSCIIYFL